MPIEPPDPGKILDALKSVLLELRDLSSARSDDHQVRSTLGHVELAIAELEQVVSAMKA